MNMKVMSIDVTIECIFLNNFSIIIHLIQTVWIVQMENDRGSSIIRHLGFLECYQDPAFRCEEASYPIGELNFACGNGQQSIIYTNNRELQIDLVESNRCLMDVMQLSLRSLLPLNTEHTNLTYERWLLMHCLAYERFTYVCGIIPVVPIFQGHVRFGYRTNRTVSLLMDPHLLLPDFVCYDEQRCPFFTYTFKIDKYTCLDHSNINSFNLIDLKII